MTRAEMEKARDGAVASMRNASKVATIVLNAEPADINQLRITIMLLQTIMESTQTILTGFSNEAIRRCGDADAI